MERTGLVPGVHMRHCNGGVSGPLHPLHHGVVQVGVKGVTEAKVTVTLRGLMTKTLTLTRDQIEKIQVPEGMRADILTQMLDVTFRGPASQLETLTAEDVTATVDFTGAKAGTYTLPLSFTINGTDRVGAYGNKYNVTVMLSADTTEPSEAETGE